MAYGLMMLSLVICTTSFSISCTKKSFKDEKRDRMVSIHKKVSQVLKEELDVDKDRLTISQSLGLLGVNEDNKLEIQDRLEKELGMKIPYSVLNGKGTIGTIVRYAVDHQEDKVEKPNPKSKAEKKKEALKLFEERARKKKEDKPAFKPKPVK